MYRIQITKEERVKTTDRDYEKIADTGNKTDDGPVYGYVEFPSEKTVITELLDQRVEGLDMEDVIKAINGIV